MFSTDNLSPNKTLIAHIANGLGVMLPYLKDDVLLSEHGDFIEVFYFDGHNVELPEDISKQLIEIGWINDCGGWMHRLQ